MDRRPREGSIAEGAAQGYDDRPRKTVDVGVVGLGYWGPNLMRALSHLPSVRLKYGCDLDETRRSGQAKLYPETHFTGDFGKLLSDEGLDAVVVASPVPTHAELARLALLANKDVFVEKPLAISPADAEHLVGLAEERGRVLMVGHLLEYHPAVSRLKTLVSSGALGDIRYVYAHRLNLGIVRRDENVLWSLGPHDLSVVLHLLEQEPIEAQATGQSFLKRGVEDVVFASLRFGDGKVAHFHISWLDPHRERKITVVGSKKMAVFDDTSREEKLKLYDKGADKPEHHASGGHVKLRFGDTVVPRLPNAEPLKLECEHFLECVVERKKPVSDGHDGLRVVRTLDALQRSLDAGGLPLPTGGTPHV
jgi:predicted dehydrogenase